MGAVGGESARDETAQTDRGASLALVLSLAAVVIGVIAWGPILTNDGPIHVVFAHLLRHDLGGDLQREVYAHGAALTTNAFGELLMGEIMRFATPELAESLLQALCLVAPTAAAAFCIRALTPGDRWTAFLVLPLSLNEMFFLGLYNFSLSLALFLLVIGTYLTWRGRFAIGGMAVVVVELVATFILHPSSFIAAWVCLAAMATGAMIADGGSLRAAFGARKHLWWALLLSLAIVVALHEPATGGSIVYGRPPLRRLLYFVSASSLGLNLTQSVLAGTFMVVLGAITAVSLARASRGTTIRRVFADERVVAGIAALAGALALMLVFPDTAGGGWTHFRRFVLYPLHIAVLLPALFAVSPRVGRLSALAAILVFIGLAGDNLAYQAKAQAQVGPAAAIDRAIGDHCTVLPIVLDTRPIGDDGHQIDMKYRPFFQYFNRLELTGDRVVLFDFLARLEVYPIRYRAGRDPHKTLFHWRPHQSQTSIDFVDVDGYERASGLHVDHVLLLGGLDGRPPALRAGIEAAIAGARVSVRSDDGRLVLFRRIAGGGASRCREPSGTAVGRGGGRAG